MQEVNTIAADSYNESKTNRGSKNKKPSKKNLEKHIFTSLEDFLSTTEQNTAIVDTLLYRAATSKMLIVLVAEVISSIRMPNLLGTANYGGQESINNLEKVIGHFFVDSSSFLIGKGENPYWWFKPSSLDHLKLALGPIAAKLCSSTPEDIISTFYQKLLLNESDYFRKGQVYTPRNIIDLILNQMIGSIQLVDFELLKDTENFLHAVKSLMDPAVGSGGFIASYIRRVIQTVRVNQEVWNDPTLLSRATESLISNIWGVDVDYFSCYIARFNIFVHLLPLLVQYTAIFNKAKLSPTNPLKLESFHLYHENSLRLYYDKAKAEDSSALSNEYLEAVRSKETQFDFVATNPPYVRKRKAKANESDERSTLSSFEIVNEIPSWLNREKKPWLGATDMQSYFIVLGASLLKPTGRLGYITPSVWLDAKNAKILRKFILDKLLIHRVFIFPKKICFEQGTGVVDGVIFTMSLQSNNNNSQSNDISVYKCTEEPDRDVFVRYYSTSDCPHVDYPQSSLSEESFAILSIGQTQLTSFYSRLEIKGRPLSEYFQIQQAKETKGNHLGLVVKVKDAKKLTTGSGKDYLRTAADIHHMSSFWITCYQPQPTDDVFIFVPPGEKLDSSQCPKLYDYLKEKREALPKDKVSTFDPENLGYIQSVQPFVKTDWNKYPVKIISYALLKNPGQTRWNRWCIDIHRLFPPKARIVGIPLETVKTTTFWKEESSKLLASKYHSWDAVTTGPDNLNDEGVDIRYLLGVLCSRLKEHDDIFNNGLKFGGKDLFYRNPEGVNKFRVIIGSNDEVEELVQHVSKMISLRAKLLKSSAGRFGNDDEYIKTSAGFISGVNRETEYDAQLTKIGALQKKIDDLVFKIYGVTKQGRKTILTELNASDHWYDEEGEDEKDEDEEHDNDGKLLIDDEDL